MPVPVAAPPVPAPPDGVVPVPWGAVPVPALVAVPVEALVPVPVPVPVLVAVALLVVEVLVVVDDEVGSATLLEAAVGTVNVGAPWVLPAPDPPPPHAATESTIATAAEIAAAGLRLLTRGAARRGPETTLGVERRHAPATDRAVV